LMMNVKANGKQVSIQIKTHDLEAKKIIEESLGRLKESLSNQNLNLAKVDVVTQANPASSDFGQPMEFNQGQSGFGRNDSQGQSESWQRGRQEFLYDEPAVSSNLKSINAARSRQSLGAGGLDLIA